MGIIPVNKISVSTAYNAKNKSQFSEIVSEFKSIGFNAVELNVEIKDIWADEIKNYVKNKELIVLGLHNFCPMINSVPIDRTYLNAYLLSSDDEQERELAVKYTMRTIDFARELDASYVVIHSGEVPTEPKGSELYSYARKFGIKNSEFEKYKMECISDRKKKSDKYFNNLLKSLDRLSVYANNNSGKKILLGIENRMYLNEIPDIEEIGKIIERFKGAPLGYWHDTGHAEINFRMGYIDDPNIYLELYSDRTVGIHLHDVRGLVDHYAPGSGEIDFTKLKKFINSEMFLTLEVHDKSDKSELIDGSDYIKTILGFN
jgi:sugar phosphate isomerase/epimerase